VFWGRQQTGRGRRTQAHSRDKKKEGITFFHRQDQKKEKKSPPHSNTEKRVRVATKRGGKGNKGCKIKNRLEALNTGGVERGKRIKEIQKPFSSHLSREKEKRGRPRTPAATSALHTGPIGRSSGGGGSAPGGQEGESFCKRGKNRCICCKYFASREEKGRTSFSSNRSTTKRWWGGGKREGFSEKGKVKKKREDLLPGGSSPIS